MKNKIKKAIEKRRNREVSDQTDDSNKVRITNDTVASHREEVLSSARKYIYPLQHSKHKIVILTTTILIVLTVAFFTYCTIALYRLNSNSTFLYRVTQVIPFPIARAGKQFVAYENYLFELRHYMHYYETQQDIDFESEPGRLQLAEFRQRALDKVVQDAYVKRLADENNISVSTQEVDKQIEVVRRQNRLGGSERVFEDVLKDYWGWSINDFKRTLRQQMLEHKVVAALDKETHGRAASALAEIKAGADFGEVAKKYSDDSATKENGGDFGFVIDRTNRDLSAITTDTLFSLQPGQVSEVVNIGYALEIIKNTEVVGDKAKGAHILFNFKDINTYVNDLKEKRPFKLYVTFPKTEETTDSIPEIQ